MERELKDRLLMQKRILNLLGITEVYALDFKKINYVRKRLDDIKVTFSTGSKVVSKTEGILTGLDDLKIFGEDIFNEAVKNTSVVPFVSEMSNMYVFKTNLSFATNIESLKLCEKGRVESFSVPQNSDEFFRILIGHEFIHSLKDINVLEYSKSQTVLDVIPLFYELIISEKIDFRSLWLNLRFFLLKNECLLYDEYSKSMKKGFMNKDLYKIARLQAGEKISSFYYALILYNMYKDNPSLIIEKIHRVLSGDYTTIDLLLELGIYNKDNDDIFSLEFISLTKSL